MTDLLLPHPYARIARALPCPTAPQRARFLDHVAATRPWAMLLPADGGVPCTLFLNPRAGLASGDRGEAAEAARRYREAFGYLDYALHAAAAEGTSGGYDVLDEQGRAVRLPPDLIEAATCVLNATVHPDAAPLLETLPLRVPRIFDAGDDRLDPIAADAELLAFAEEYTREELGGFLCPTDREAWASRWLQDFQRLYAPRHAEQRAGLEQALAGLLAWVYDVVD